MTGACDDLITANRQFAEKFTLSGFDGVAHASVAIVTCMDSRIDPLGMLELKPGDAKIFRNPGGRVTGQALEALVLGVHLLNVRRILVIPHTRCAMASSTVARLPWAQLLDIQTAPRADRPGVPLRANALDACAK